MNPKTIVSVGSIALDWLELPDGTKGETLGGSLTYFTRSAGILAPVNVVGVIGTDYPDEGMTLFKQYGASLEDLQIEEGESLLLKIVSPQQYHNVGIQIFVLKRPVKRVL